MHAHPRKSLTLLATALALVTANAGAATAAGPILARAPSTQPSLAAFHSQRDAIPDLDAADRAAHASQQNLAEAESRALGILRHQNALLDAAWRSAEDDVDAARDAAWSSFSARSSLATLVQGPLQLAMLDLQIELRRSLGPVFTTEVPGLDRGCGGDLVADRIVAGYGAAIVEPLGASSDATHAALEAFAVQVACLGSAQLAKLDSALANGFKSVALRMADHGLANLEPGFARIVAPLELLLLDARKHRGKHARAWRWFRVYDDALETATQSAGWATEELLVWDRRHGMLVGLPACNGRFAPDCVDLDVLLDSVEDPRALGLGGCGLAAMISRGTESIAGDTRYACPVQDCSAPSPTSGPSASPNGPALGGMNIGAQPHASLMATGSLGGPVPSNPLAGSLTSLWGPSFDPGSLSSMLGFCQGGGDRHGPNFDVSSCLDDLPSPDAQNPFAAHIACMEEVIGDGEPSLGNGALRGVPNGPECGLFGEGEAPPPPKTEEKDPKTEEKEPEEKDPAAKDTTKPAPPIDGATPKTTIKPWARQLTEGDSGSHAFGKTGLIEWVELVDAQTGEFVRYNVTITGAAYGEAWTEFERQVYGEHGLMKEFEFTERGDALEVAIYDAEQGRPNSDPTCKKGCHGSSPSLPPSSGGRQGCMDPLSCGGNECTGLGEQVAAATECNEALIDDLTEAAGRPKPDPTNPPDIVSNWSPDSDFGIDTDSVGICLSSGQHPRPPAHCGLILCANGGMAVPLGDTCGCHSTPPMSVQDVCIEARCADGMVPGPNCECGGGADVGIPPVPPDVTNLGGERPY